MTKIKVDTAIEVFVNAFPLIDDTDFKSRETGVAYNASGMDLVWNFQTPDGAVSQTAVTPTTAGVYDWTHVGDGMYKIEIPASGGASINNDTEGVGWFTGVATGVLPWASPRYEMVPANISDSLVKGTDLLQVDLTQILGVAQSATDLKDFADDGYDPATNKVQGVVLTDTLTTYTGNTVQTGDSFARLGVAGAGLTALGDTRIANLDAAVSSRSTYAGGAVASVTAGVTVTTNNDKTGYGLSSAAIQSIWDALTSALTTVGSIGKLLVDNINATISSRLATASYTAPLDAAGTRTAVGLAAADLDAQLADLPTVAEVTARTLAAADYATATNLATVAGYLDTEIAAIKAKTDNLPAAPAATGDIPSAASIATAVLTTAMTESYAADGVAPTLAQAILLTQQSLTEFAIVGTALTVKKLNGSTTAAVLTLDSATAPTSVTRAS